MSAPKRDETRPHGGWVKLVIRIVLGLVVGMIGIGFVVLSNGRSFIEAVLIFAVAVVLGFISHRLLESAWGQWVDLHESSSGPALVPTAAKYFLGWPLVAAVAIGVTFYCACAPPADWITPHRHSFAFDLTVAASILILTRVVLRWVLGQVRLCPLIFDCTRTEAKASLCLAVSGFGCLITNRSLIDRSGVLVAAVSVAVVSIVLIFDADSHLRLQLRDKDTPALTELILQVRPVTWAYVRLSLRWREGAGAVALSVALRLGAVFVAATALAAVPGIVSATENLVSPPPPTHVHAKSPNPLGFGPGTHGGTVGGGGGNATPPATPPAAPPVLPAEYAQVCGSDPASVPGGDSAQTPDWVKTELYDDWLGTGAPGANIAGCAGPLVELNDGYDDVWYQIGTLNGQLTSVGVASARNKGVIFLADGGAAQFVHGLLQAGFAASGSDRVNVGNGDAQLVYDKSGTWLLIRSTLHQTGDQNVSTAYTVLPPAAFTPWLDATENTKSFLWPTYVAGNSNTGGTIDLSFTPYGDPVGTITFAANGQLSTLEVNGSTQMVTIGPANYPIGTVTQYTPSNP